VRVRPIRGERSPTTADGGHTSGTLCRILLDRYAEWALVDVLARTLFVDVTTRLPGDHLVKVGIASMRVRLEGR
jgi:hypothetical protein